MTILRMKVVGLTLLSMIALAGLSGCFGSSSSTTPPPTSSPTVTPSPNPSNVLTYHNDLGRTGQFLAENTLNRTNVNPTTFGQIAQLPVDGLVYAQPLYIQNVNVSGVGVTDLLLVETEHDSVFAFNEKTLSTTPVWKRSFLGDSVLACTSCATATSTEVNAPNIYPEIGITATPVIDPNSMTMYVLALTVENGTFYHKLHALDLTTGKERTGSPVAITATAAGGGFGSQYGNITFDAQWQLSRAGLTLYDGNLILAFSSFDDQEPSHGWVMSYNASTLKQNFAMITSPNSGIASIWGGAPAIDSSGNIYISTSNDDGNNATILDYGNSVVKMNSGLEITDWFQPYNSIALSQADIDVGSGGLLLVPPQPGPTPNIAIAGGKQGTIYVLNQDNLGQMNTSPSATSDTNILQEVTNLLPSGKSCCAGIYGTPSYYEGKVFIAAAGDYLRAFPISNGQLNVSAALKANEEIAIRGSTASISSNGLGGANENGIIWILNASAYQYSSTGASVTNGPAVLMAYSTDDLSSPLYRSDRVPSDAAGYAVKYAVPTVADGKVFVGGQGNSNAFLAGQTAAGTLGNGMVTVYGGIPTRTLPVQTGGSTPPGKLSETGFFTNLSTMTPASGVLPYDVNSPLWSDGAGKARWLVLPSGGKITFNTTQPWTFPVGTQLIKLFALDLGNGVTTNVETRVLTLDSSGWSGVTYQWQPVGAPSSQQTDATLLSASATQSYTITGSGGTTSTQSWYFPSPSDCLTCHTSANGGALGVTTRQLNRVADAAGAGPTFPTILSSSSVDSWIGSGWTETWVPNPANANTTECSSTAAASGSQNQLALWNNMGLFTTNIGDPTQCDAYALDSDPTSTPEKRFRSYVAVNCAICHSPTGTAGVNIDFSYDTALANMGIVNVVPAKGNVGVNGALLVTPGNAGESVVALRMDTTNTSYRMPPIASSVIDSTAVGVTSYWIDNLSTSEGSSVVNASVMRSKFTDWRGLLSQ